MRMLIITLRPPEVQWSTAVMRMPKAIQLSGDGARRAKPMKKKNTGEASRPNSRHQTS